MFGLSYSEFVQGSALRTWNCVAHFASLLWYKFNHLKDPIMPRSRRRHHSRSRSRSRSHSHERDREPKRRKIDSYDSPQHRRSVSSVPEANDCNVDDRGIDEPDIRKNDVDLSASNSSSIVKADEVTMRDETKSEQIDDVEENKNKDESKQVIDLDDYEEKVLDSVANSEVKEIVVESETSDDEEIEESDPVENSEAKDESIKNNTPNKLKEKNNDLILTPNKTLSPKQLQKRLESEKKRQERQKEKDERERKRLDEKEEKERQRLEEKKRINDEKLRLKQEREEVKMKEKLAREEKKKKEQEEKDKKRREKEEKDEQKKKEREQEKLKKQQEIEEKNKEKQKLEEQKQKTAAAFVNFFVPKKTDSEERKLEDSSTFMPFEIKSDMRLAPIIRKTLTSDAKTQLDECLEKEEDAKLYLDELMGGKQTGKFEKTWPFEDVDQDDDLLLIIEDNLGESIVEQKSKLEKMRAKFLKFHENQRPPYFGTFKKKSKLVGPRKPFGKDTIFNYEVDSDEEWEEEGEGESLKGTDDEDEKENESDNDYEVDNDLFVPHGHLSDDEVDDEVNAKLSPESHKQKLKLLRREFEEEMKSKTPKIKPRVIGCIWYNKTKSNVEEAIDRYLQPFAIICSGQIEIKKRSDFAFASVRKVPKQLNKEHVPLFLKLIHGSVGKSRNIITSFIEHMSNNGVELEVNKSTLGRQLKNFAQWKKCPDEGVMHNKMCWYVREDIRKEYNVDLTLPNKISSKRAKVK